MKFFAVALAAFVAATNAAPSAKTQNLSGSSIRGGLDASRMIMEKAYKVNRQGQRVLDGNFELSSAYSLQFNTCVSLKTEPTENGDIIFDDALIKYTTDGAISPQKSFILFNVCETAYCDYYASDDNLYVIDIATYMSAFTEFYVTREEEYCSACQDSVSYCKYYQYQKANNKYYNEYQGAQAYYNQEDAAAAAATDDAAAAANNGGRKLSRYNFELIDCDVCTKMGCLNGQTDDAVEKTAVEDIAAWVDGITQCYQTEALFLNYYSLYAGFMCNEDGSGVEIATFLDEECSIYNSKVAYTAIAVTTDQEMMTKATDMVTYPFLNKITCNGDYAYLSMDEYRQQAQYYSSNNGNNQQAGQASEYCANLFNGGDVGKAISLTDCNEDGQQDAEDENAVVDQYYDYDYYWYQFTLSYEDSQDTEATCKIIRNLQGEYETVYRWSGSGQLYNYGTGPPKNKYSYNTDAVRNFFSTNYDKMDATLIAAIVVGVLVALTAFGCIMYSCCCASSVPNKYMEHRKELDVKRERLVDPDTGKLL